MDLQTRKILDRSFSGFGMFSTALMAAALIIILLPIFVKGSGAFIFKSTVEHRRFIYERFGRGDPEKIKKDVDAAAAARRPLYDVIKKFEEEIKTMPSSDRRRYRVEFNEFKKSVHRLLGPMPGEPIPVLVRDKYGQTRWDRAETVLRETLYIETWDYSDTTTMGKKVLAPRAEIFANTSLEPAFAMLKSDIKAMLRPKLTVYGGFFTDNSVDSHIFGGIKAEILGTLYLAIGAMLFAVPMGVIAAVYLTEYASESRLIDILRGCISTLAGVPSIVFGLFGLAFFINTVHISPGKSVLAGSLTLGLLVLPTIIRASEEAIRSVPLTYKEAALSLGSGKWHTVLTVTLPAALPGILTGIVISMGRAAGETAPIIFTAAVSVGKPLKIWQTFTNPTPALPWNIYNLCTEHEAVEQIRHVQFGMVLTLVAIVLALNLFAILLRAGISKKLKGL